MKSVRKLKKFRVLVGTPHADVKNYCFDEFLQSLKTFTYDNYDAVVVDNSKSRKNTKKIRKAGVGAMHVKPKLKVNRQYIAESHEMIKHVALDGGYDFLLHLESDIFPPSDIIERLLIHQKPVVSAMYPIDFGDDSHLMLQTIEKRGGENVKHTINTAAMHDFNIIDGELHQVYACGLGCTLIHRDILSKFSFRWQKEVNAHPDTFFANDLHQLGIKQYLDTSILCDHKNSEWIHF